jgi:RNA polymerase sigma factor (sigma-70 family)
MTADFRSPADLHYPLRRSILSADEADDVRGSVVVAPMAESPFKTPTLHDLLDRMRVGDTAAVDELLRRVCGRLERLARKMLRKFPKVSGWAETGDVLQSAVLRLLRALRAVRPSSTRDFYGLAAEQMRRELLDLARHFRRRGSNQTDPSPDDSQADDRDPPDPAPGPADLDRWTRFHQEVEQLSIKERETVGLLFYHNWKQADAAKLLQVNEKTIRRWWQSALRKLRHVLQEESPEDPPE